LHFGTQSETYDFSEDGHGGSAAEGFPVMPKLNQRMEKVAAHKEAKEAKEGKGAHGEHKGGSPHHGEHKGHKK
jgi:hypothetical protein